MIWYVWVGYIWYMLYALKYNILGKKGRRFNSKILYPQFYIRKIEYHGFNGRYNTTGSTEDRTPRIPRIDHFQSSDCSANGKIRYWKSVLKIGPGGGGNSREITVEEPPTEKASLMRSTIVALPVVFCATATYILGHLLIDLAHPPFPASSRTGNANLANKEYSENVLFGQVRIAGKENSKTFRGFLRSDCCRVLYIDEPSQSSSVTTKKQNSTKTRASSIIRFVSCVHLLSYLFPTTSY